MYNLVFTETYLKREKEFLKKHKDLIPRDKKVLKLADKDIILIDVGHHDEVY